MVEIRNDRYAELVKAEHTVEIIKRYVADEDFINTKVIKVILDMKESEEK